MPTFVGSISSHCDERFPQSQINSQPTLKREPNYAYESKIWDTFSEETGSEAACMVALANDNLDAIAALCREYGVLRLELFGSAATGAFDPERFHIDFIVEYPSDYEFGPWLKRYFEFKERLDALLGYSVDLVMANAKRKPRFIASVDESRQLLYAA